MVIKDMNRTKSKHIIILAVVFMLSSCSLIAESVNEKHPLRNATTVSSADAYYHYSLGVNHVLNGDYEKAIREYEATLRIDPREPYVTVALAQLYVQTDNITKAIELLEKSLIYHPAYIDTHLLLGSLYVKLREFDNAIKEFTYIIQSDPKRLEPYLYLSLLYRDKKDYARAISSLKDFLKFDPNNIMAHYYMAKIYTEMNLYAEAESWLKKALDIKPLFESALIDLALLYDMQKKNNEVIEIYKKLIKANPFGMEARFKLGKTYLELNRYKEAESEFNTIIKLDSTNLDARFSLGLVYFFEGKDFDKAIEEFLIVLNEDPHNDRVRYFLASSYEEKKKYGHAFKEFNKIPPGSKLYESARIHMGIILKDANRIDDAINLTEKALENKSNSDELLGFLASLHEENHDEKTAEEILHRGLILSPRSVDLHYRLGVIYENTGRHEQSIKEMEEVLKIDPDNAEALNFIGYSYADRGVKLDEAERMIRRALELKPENGFITDSLGWVYFKLNKTNLAIRYLEKATSIIPDDPTIAEHLGDAYEKGGLLQKALMIYRKALKLKPKDKEALAIKIKRVIEKSARQGKRPSTEK